jgi:small-conductance mechanosensitive channel
VVKANSAELRPSGVIHPWAITGFRLAGFLLTGFRLTGFRLTGLRLTGLRLTGFRLTGCRGLSAGGRSLRIFALVAALVALVVAITPAPFAAAAAAASVPSTGMPAPVQPEAPLPAWVSLEGRPVIEIRTAVGAQTPAGVARRASEDLRVLADSPIAPEQLQVRELPPYTMIGLVGEDGRFQPRLALDDRAAAAFRLSRSELAVQYRDQLRGAIRQYRSSHTPLSWLRGTALALLVLAIYLLWIRGQNWLNLRLAAWINQRARQGGLGLRLGGNQVLDSQQGQEALQLLRRLGHWSLLLLISYLLVPLLLGLFPPTQVIAEGLRSHLLGVLERLLNGLFAAIPSLLTILLILALTRLAMQGCTAWFQAIERGRLQFPGFYSEWAKPTGRLVSAAILMAGLVIAFPYVPGSGSKVFQGAGLFVGVLAALGSSAVATNVISGLMLIYTRAFQEGDRVEINGVVGKVQDRDLLVTRIQTPRDELVSIPNATVITSSIINFSFSRREIQRPVAVATTVTIGYDVPWRQVQALLLQAARSTDGIVSDPEPLVLQTALNDFHISYELNAHVREVDRYRETLSALLAAIQDSFAAADVEIMSPGYHAIRDGNARTVPSPPPDPAP